MKTLLFYFATIVASVCLSTAAAQAEVKLPSLLSKHAVLQRSEQTRIWGKAAPGEKVKISLGEAHGETSAGADGKWKLSLDLSQMGEGPFDLIVEGNNRVVVPDVLIGEVWVCGGQSNMAVTLIHMAEAPEEIAKPANPSLRQFRVLQTASGKPEDEVKGDWTVARPETVKQFTAVGYFFGKSLQTKLNQPVGIIHGAVAGTVALAWMPSAAIDGNPEWKGRQAEFQKRIDDYARLKDGYVPSFHQWEAKFGRADHPADPSSYATVDVPLDEWKKVSLPSFSKALGLPDSGAVWFRKRVTFPSVPPEVTLIQLGAARDYNALYVNGKKIKERTVESMQDGFACGYYLPKGTFHEGENTLVIRLFTPRDRAGFQTNMYLEYGTTKIPLNGEWLAKVEYELPALSDEARKVLPTIPPNPGLYTFPCFYNAMIHPLMAFTIKGAVWYQGESDAGRPSYGKMMEAVIQGWRSGWGYDFPFYFCQLPNFAAKRDLPSDSAWADTREAQSKNEALPNTGQAVLIDVGDEDIHPNYKREVGERLARLALARTYKQSVVDSGPVYNSMKIEGGKVRLSFTSTDGGLVAKPLPAEYQPTYMSPALKPLVRHSPDGELEGFAIRGQDKKWVWATAKIEGDTVIVSSSAVPKPVAVRYAWADNPTCNLYNGAGLPASPFQAGH